MQGNQAPDGVADVYPLSPMQEGMLFHTLMQPGSGIYLMQNRYRIEGELDPAQFQQAWREVLARHSVLRSSFVWKTQKRPLQVVHRNVELPFELIDLRSASLAERERRIEQELERERIEGLPFGKAPLMRVRLFRLERDLHEFVHSFHHILLDEWCTSVLMMDFLRHYQALATGRKLELAPAPGYRSYIDWIQRQDLAAAQRFFRGYLQGFSSATPLGLAPARAEVSSAPVVDLTLRLDATVSARLHELAQKHKLTLNTLVQGAWAVLSSRYGGTRDVLFGVTVAGRPPELPGVEDIVGLFINTLPLRVSVPPDAPLLPWLGQLLEQNLLLRQYEYTPLVDVQGWSQLEKGQPLFNSLLVFESAPIAPVLRDGRFVFTLRDMADRVHTNYPITAMAWPDTEIGLKLSYDTRSVEADAAARLLAHLRSLLESMAERPDARLGELAMLTPAERQQALVAWNATTSEREELSSLPARFERQVALAPHAVAVACGPRRVTYRELNRLANRVAHALVEAGVGPESRVLVMDERGIELIALLLGVFKAGAAYVPIEPSFPAERIAELARRAEPAVILTRARLAGGWRGLLPEGGPPLFTLEQLLEAPLAEENPPLRGGENSLAYVIYTSGSTGVPKGVMIERRGMLANMLSKVPLFELGPESVVAQTASIAFDISVWQLFTALLVGGRVEVVPQDVAADPARLLERVEQAGVSVLEVVPAVLQGLLDAAAQLSSPPALAALRALLPTGEALPVPLARAWLQRYPRVPLFNAYGPAECSDDVSLQRLDAPPPESSTSVPIGGPTPHGTLYVRAELDGEPLPVGVSGELYVGGIGVGRGYLGDARRTAELFVPDPFARAPGQRLYRTGDLVRQRADGAFEFVGRRDQQVKIRGYRIELGEIETRLAAHPALAEAAVSAREDRPGQHRLVAYMVASGTPPSAEELRAWLAQTLPEYMLPSVFVALSALPRSPNGKLQRSLLPPPDDGGSAAKQPPRTETEQRLAAIWQELLGAAEVGVEDSFFALGGHSLLLTQVLARVRRAFEIEPPLAELFQAATLAEQARVIERTRERALLPALPPPTALAQPTGQLSFAQERLWFTSQLEAEASSLNVPGAVRLLGALDVARLEHSLARVVARQAALRTRFRERDGRPEALVEAAVPLRIEQVSLGHLPPAEREASARQLIDRRAAEPFDLGRGPLLRVALLRLDEQDHVLLVVLHHIISDGWSLQLLVRELVAYYTAPGAAELLEPLAIQYSDYVAWQRSYLSDAVLERQLAFWRRELGSAPPVLALRTDQARPAERSARGARHFFQLSLADGQRLQEWARSSARTPFMILLAAFHTLLARYSGQSDICVGTPVAQRTRPELEPLIGLFVNTLVLRIDAGGEPSFAELVERVRERVLLAQAHQDLPFERLVQELRVRRDLSRTPLFQALFSLDEGGLLGGSGRLELPASAGLELLSWEVDPGGAQFDLSLHIALEGERWSGAIEYASELFDSDTVARIAGDFCALLSAALRAPHTRLAALPLSATPALQPPASGAPTAQQSPAAEPAAPDVRAGAGPAAGGSRALLELGRIWAEVLGVASVAEGDNFFELGGDSILSLQVVARARRAGLRLRTRDLFQHQTLAALARASESVAADAAAAAGRPRGPAALSPIQRRFFERALPNPHHHNQTLLLRPRSALNWQAVERALGAVLEQHAALRLRYTQTDAGWVQEHAPEASLAWSLVDLSATPSEQRRARLEAQTARWQASLDLSAGPLFRAVGFELGEGEQRLLLVAHHLVVDAVSWRVLLDDLAFGYEAAVSSAAISSAAIDLGSPSCSFQAFAARLERAAAEPELSAQARHWLEQPWQQVARLPVDHPDGSRAESQLAEHLAGIDEAETSRLLEAAASSGRTQVEPLLLTALGLALASWRCPERGAPALLAIELEGHGRDFFDEEELDVARSVGWFTNVYPVLLSLDAARGPAEALANVQQALARVPRLGLPYALARHLSHSELGTALRALPAVQVGFNYLGQWDQLIGEGAAFALAPEAPGPERAPENPLAYELEVDVAVYERRLEATLRYSRARFAESSIAELGSLFTRALRSLIELPSAARRGAGPAPLEPASVVLSTTELDALLGQMD